MEVAIDAAEEASLPAVINNPAIVAIDANTDAGEGNINHGQIMDPQSQQIEETNDDTVVRDEDVAHIKSSGTSNKSRGSSGRVVGGR